jgi:hypothetical protein
MSEVVETQSGTKFVDGIEYNQYPPPVTLIKAMESKWAAKLFNEGAIRLYSVDYYQTLESPELGDVHEGRGMLRLNGHPMQMGSINEVFIWCGALPNISAATLKGLSSSYNTIIRITNVVEFTKRIVCALNDFGCKWHTHLGQVTYNRGDEVSKETLKNQKWHYNIFQKSAEYEHQREYRLAFTNISFQQINKKWIELSIESSKDIMKMET